MKVEIWYIASHRDQETGEFIQQKGKGYIEGDDIVLFHTTNSKQLKAVRYPDAVKCCFQVLDKPNHYKGKYVWQYMQTFTYPNGSTDKAPAQIDINLYFIKHNATYVQLREF